MVRLIVKKRNKCVPPLFAPLLNLISSAALNKRLTSPTSLSIVPRLTFQRTSRSASGSLVGLSLRLPLNRLLHPFAVELVPPAALQRLAGEFGRPEGGGRGQAALDRGEDRRTHGRRSQGHASLKVEPSSSRPPFPFPLFLFSSTILPSRNFGRHEAGGCQDSVSALHRARRRGAPRRSPSRLSGDLTQGFMARGYRRTFVC